MDRAEKILKSLSDLCYQCGTIGATINYSTYSKKYYLHIPCEIKDGIVLRGVVEHRDTIEEAAEAIIEAIEGKLLVFNASSESRKEVFFTRGDV